MIVSFALEPLAARAAQADCNKLGVYCNPIAVDSSPKLITTIVDAVVKIGGPLAAAAIVFVGLRFVIAAASGDQAGLTKARQMLWYVLIGTVIIVGGSALAEAVVKFIRPTD